jgi:hypothetical protein
LLGRQQSRLGHLLLDQATDTIAVAFEEGGSPVRLGMEGIHVGLFAGCWALITAPA